MRKNSILIIVALFVIVIGSSIWYFGWHQNTSPNGEVACTQEAMQCPDGSYVGRTGPNCEFAQCPTGGTPSTTSTTTGGISWLVYANSEFGFSFAHPPTWQKSNDVLSIANPHISFGNPLSGIATYSIRISIEDDPRNLSAADFVAKLLSDLAAQDASNSAQAPAPHVTPQFAKQYALNVGGYPAYELDDVFESDHQAEQIYVEQNKKMIVFDFPSATANPNIANAAGNNAIAHKILDTLKIDSGVWKFCGGIAAGKFPCDTGYSCKLDGNFPDAGGHCVKN
jgi:hypothetical protein